MSPDIQAIIEYVKSVGVAGAAGTFAGLSVAFYGAVRIFRLPGLQALLPEKFRWAELPAPVRVGVVLGLPVLAAVAGALAAGLAPSAVAGAGIAALVAALSAGGVDGAVSAIRPTAPATLPQALALSAALGAGKPKDSKEG